MSIVGYGNHYSRQVLHLEAVLQSKIKQLSLLEEEQQLLLEKENQLHRAIQTIEGPLAITKEALVVTQSAGSGTAAAPGSVRVQDLDVASAASSESIISTGDSGGSSSSAQPWSSSLPPAPYKDTAVLLQRLNQSETRVQQVLQQMGVCDSEGYKQLYGTQLLCKAVQDPAAAASYLATTREQRMDYFSQAAAQMSLLLDKYDSNISSAGFPHPREQLEEVLDQLLTRIFVCALWDSPGRYMSNIMYNVDTHEFEPYPEGWWRSVVQALDLDVQQKAAIKLTWDRVKVQLQRLTLVYEQLQRRLQSLHRQQLQDNRQFDSFMRALPGRRHVQIVMGQQQQQQQQQQPVPPEQQDAAMDLQQLFDDWLHEAPSAADACSNEAADPLVAQLAAELQAEVQLEAQVQALMQQQQHCSWGGNQPTHSAAAAVGAAAGGAAAIARAVQQPGQQPLRSFRSGGMEVPGAPPTVQQHSGVSPHGGASSSRSTVAAEQFVMPQLDEAEEVLLQEGCVERQHIERCLQAITDKCKALHFCQSLFLSNTLSKKQLATMCGHTRTPQMPSACVKPWSRLAGTDRLDD